jgi:hypothetical protein
MKVLLTWALIAVISSSPILAQASDTWSAVTTVTAPNYVRVKGTRAGQNHSTTGMLHSVDETQITVATRRNGKPELVQFDRANVRSVELVVGQPNSRQKSILKGLGVGVFFALLGTIGMVRGQNELGAGAMAGFYGLTLGGGAGVGALLSEGEDYMVIYDTTTKRP